MSRNSVATSRSSVFEGLEVRQVRADDVAQRDVVELDLLAQNEMQEQVERTCEGLGVHLI